MTENRTCYKKVCIYYYTMLSESVLQVIPFLKLKIKNKNENELNNTKDQRFSIN